MSILAAAGRYTLAVLATPIALTAMIATANAVVLTPEQQAIVDKYKISRADQEKLFGSQTVAAHAASAREQVASAPSVSPAPGFLSGTYVWVGADTYKSIGERLTNINGGTGSLTGSYGGVAGFNSGFSFGESNFGVQGGASIGVYDPKGRIRLIPDSTDPEYQTYYTVGFYKRGDMAAVDPSLADRISLGVVYDGFHAQRWGINANDIELGQVRGTLGFALNEKTEIGVWGTGALNDDQAAVTVAGNPNARSTIRAMNQANAYVKHNFDFGGELLAYIGMFDGADIAEWQAGALGRVPLSDSWSAILSANYVVPSAGAGPRGSGEEQFSASVGFAYHFGGNAVSSTVTGNRELPLLDVASNRSFLITD